MQNTHKTFILMLTLLASAILLPSFKGSQAAPTTTQVPTMPHQVSGKARVNDISVPEGTRVSAWCSGVKVAEGVTVESEGASWYSLDVPPDNPDTTENDGCISDDVISFKIASFPADQTEAWVAEKISYLDLTATSTPPVPHTVAGLVRVNNAFISEGIMISAWCGGIKYGEDSTTVVDGQSHYSLDVPGDDLVTLVKDGCNDGETIHFKIGSLNAVETLSWQTGQSSTLDLSATSELPGSYQVYGQVRVNGEFVKQGTLVSAWCEGVKVVENGTSIDEESEAWYVLNIPGDDPFSPQKEGCGSGMTITLMISSLEADQSAVWGTEVPPVRIDLSAEGVLLQMNFLPLILR